MGRVIRNIVWGFSAAGIVLTAVPASAAPITWQHVFDASPNVYFAPGGADCTSTSISATCASLTYLHDLTTDGFVPGLSSPDQITGGSLMIDLFDDASDPGGQAEFVKIAIDGLALGGAEPASQTFTLGSLSFAILLSLQQDGILNMTLRHQAGDFYFDKSTLLAEGTRQERGGDDSVPEPATLMLFGAGAVGFLTRVRQRQRRG